MNQLYTHTVFSQQVTHTHTQFSHSQHVTHTHTHPLSFPSLHFLKEQEPVGSEQEETFLPLLHTQKNKILLLPVIFWSGVN